MTIRCRKHQLPTAAIESGYAPPDEAGSFSCNIFPSGLGIDADFYMMEMMEREDAFYRVFADDSKKQVN